MSPLLPQSEWSRRHADHLLSRAGFLGSPEEREAFYQLGRTEGIGAAVESLIDPEVDWDAYPFPAFTQSEAGLDAAFASGEAGAQFDEWYMRQLLEVAPTAAKMFKFWVDHFACTSDMVMTDVARAYYPFTHFDIIRRNAVGSIKTLTGTD